ncbi:hypothetical protein [Bosea sp. Tri-49]|uniref:hypothetical protein n=1 Tax=Bosea sp. Tri-49 TaxID=1867715 RepID=UPI0013E010B3|nr:hypothetical protein [Bosea sp. Tri-49]
MLNQPIHDRMCLRGWRPLSPDGKGINILGRESGYKLADAVQPGRTAAWKI